MAVVTQMLIQSFVLIFAMTERVAVLSEWVTVGHADMAMVFVVGLFGYSIVLSAVQYRPDRTYWSLKVEPIA